METPVLVAPGWNQQALVEALIPDRVPRIPVTQAARVSPGCDSILYEDGYTTQTWVYDFALQTELEEALDLLEIDKDDSDGIRTVEATVYTMNRTRQWGYYNALVTWVPAEYVRGRWDRQQFIVQLVTKIADPTP